MTIIDHSITANQRDAGRRFVLKIRMTQNTTRYDVDARHSAQSMFGKDVVLYVTFAHFLITYDISCRMTYIYHTLRMKPQNVYSTGTLRYTVQDKRVLPVETSYIVPGTVPYILQTVITGTMTYSTMHAEYKGVVVRPDFEF